ncbi:MAG TPA: general secretion pathway protein GspB [Steroidobacteraceae bacterium]|nr:general secretion pathway protein GspB [Steroidobacteraceae bacterium]
MSFILDALKKSELERQRQSVPGLVDSGTARPRPRLPVWAIALGVLLAVNLLVLLFVLTRSFLAPSNMPATAVPARSSTKAAGGPDVIEPQRALPPDGAEPATADIHFSPLDVPGRGSPGRDSPGRGSPGRASPGPLGPVYAPEIPPASPLPVAAAAPAKSVAAEIPATIKTHRRDPLLTDEDYKVNDDEVLPTINEMTLGGAQTLPELHLDVHVYATRPAERFVYVNMRKYHEGATLQEGPTIERIRRDGVILSYQGLRFLLPRQ